MSHLTFKLKIVMENLMFHICHLEACCVYNAKWYLEGQNMTLRAPKHQCVTSWRENGLVSGIEFSVKNVIYHLVRAGCLEKWGKNEM